MHAEFGASTSKEADTSLFSISLMAGSGQRHVYAFKPEIMV